MSIEERSPQESQDNARFVQELQSDGPRREVIGRWFLKPVGKRPALGNYLTDLWSRRHFIWADSRARAFTAGRGMILGNAWLILQPMINGAIYFLIFGLLLQTSRGIDRFVGYLIIGVFLFQFTARSLISGATAITGSRAMIRGFTFPRASLPIAVILREALNMLPVIGTMMLLIVLIPSPDATDMSPPHADITWRWLLFPLVFALHTVFNAGVAFFAARIVAQVPDFRHLFQFVQRLWFYGSGIMFTFDRFVSDPQILTLLGMNPVFIVLDMSRDLLLYGVTPGARSWLILTLWALGTAAVGFLFFWRAEERYGRE